ncbi:MAG: FKBP-type peptidyl-prolyl cis-trans isomerase [Candidatus Symbiodolus clandestinus]
MKAYFRKFLLCSLLGSLTIPGFLIGQATSHVQASETVSDETQKTAYALGVFIGQMALRDLKFTQDGSLLLDSSLSQLNQQISQRAEIKQKKEVEQQLRQGEQFRQRFAKEQGVTKLKSGLLYQIIRAGVGVAATANDTVVVHYTGTLVDGSRFDSSYDRSEPTTLPLNQVIAGWTEGLQKIKKGGKIKLVIPPELAYGDQSSSSIPGNATLIFEIELIDINPPLKKSNEGSDKTMGTKEMVAS